MSFGFSIGDFITVSKLISEITNSLKDARGATSEYQGIIRELECLNHALHRLDKLQLSKRLSSDSLDSIKYAALSCRRPLEDFLAKIRKYEDSLGLWAKRNIVKGTVDKLKWSFGVGKSDEIAKLQSYLNVHVGTINILMVEHGLKALDIVAETAEVDRLRIHERLQDNRNIINNIKDRVNAQRLAVVANVSMLTKLYQMISGEFCTSLRSLTNLVSRVCISTQQIYGVVLDIKSSLPPPDTRWTFFQAPLLIEDALGCRYPVPSEYSFELLNEIIRLRFKVGPGSQDVKVGNYELFKTQKSEEVVTANTRLFPGTSITMAIIVARPVRTGEHCPMPQCASDQILPTTSGGRFW
ncbi:hypothetical protein AOQ84DRAFT_305017 [Glonium stellatum]|uniref:Ubiquitin-like domain-containing protein n=1 Tax=Glonium stellatum TaxID=574774 RepID=A0A8E2EPJ2_9PEZI|nr:hypothetical protein AOQ84DRAFT_305017 [Glonium stellatum]